MLFLLSLTAPARTRLLVLPDADDAAKDLEILVLRQQLRVLRRTAGRPKLTARDRVLLAPPAACSPQAVGVVARHPQTLLRSPRPRATNVEPSQGTHAGPTTDRPRDRGTQPAAGAAEPAMGCVRISGALRKLGIRVGATTTGTTLRRHGLSPAPRRSGPTWARFLPAQAEAIVACDFLHGGDDPAQDAVDAVVRPAQQQTGHRCRRHGQP